MRSLMLLMMLLSVACSDERRDKRKNRGIDADNLTLQMIAKRSTGDDRFMLVLCDDYDCRNTLREHDGDEFYFSQDYQEVRVANRHLEKNMRADYRPSRRHDRKGNDRHVYINYGSPRISAGVSINGRVGISYTSRSTREDYYHNNGSRSNRFRARLHLGRSDDRNDLVFVGYDRSGDAVYLHRDNHYVGSTTDVEHFVDDGQMALVDAVAEDSQWRNRKKLLQRLFVDGERITVSKSELRSLLEIVADAVDAELDDEVADFLDRRRG